MNEQLQIFQKEIKNNRIPNMCNAQLRQIIENKQQTIKERIKYFKEQIKREQNTYNILNTKKQILLPNNTDKHKTFI